MKNFWLLITIVVSGWFCGDIQAASLNKANVFTNMRTGQKTIAFGYDSGVLEFRDWTGKLLATRSGLGNITAIETYRSKTAVTPRMFIGSSDGTVRIINPTTIGTDLIKRTFVGTITFVWGWDKYLWVGVNDGIKGTLYLLDNATLLPVKSMTGVGPIKFIDDVEWISGGVWGEGVVVAGSDGGLRIVQIINNSNGTINSLRVKSSRSNLGQIKGLASEDIDGDGNSEIAISSTSYNGSFVMMRASNITVAVLSRTGLGVPGILDMSPEVDIAGVKMLAIALTNGSVRTFKITVGNGLFTCTTGAQRIGFGSVVALGLDDFYGTGCDQIIICSTDSAKAAFHITGANVSPDLTYFKIAQ